MATTPTGEELTTAKKMQSTKARCTIANEAAMTNQVVVCGVSIQGGAGTGS
jgi:hypothetical protein